jgi:NHLM bacteriocin system ABC transporter peptidase/ATP-binding protein
MENLECGAASLAMMLGYFGRHVPLAVLRDECNVSRDGATAGQLARVAGGYGLTPHAFKTELGSLGKLPTPFIAYWGFNHFVVVEGWDRKHVFLNDPACGPRRVTWAQMDKDFTGVALTFDQSESFTPGGKRPSALAPLPRLLRGHIWPMVFAAIVGVFYAIPGVAAAGFLSFFINSILANQQTELIAPFFLALAVALVVVIGLGWIQAATLVQATASLSTSLAARLAWRMLRLPMRYFTQRSAGEIAWRLDLPDGMSQQLAGPLPAALVSVVSVVIYLVVMLLVCVPVALAALVVALLNIVALRATSRREREGQQAMLQDEGKMQGEVVSGLAAIEFVKATGSEDEVFNRFTGFHAMLLNKRQSLMTISNVLATVPGFLSIVASALAIGIGAFAVLRGSLSIGGLVSLQVLVAGFLAPFTSFVRLSSAMNAVTGDLTKIDDVLGQAPESSGVRTQPVGPAAPGAGTEKLAGHVEFRDIVFGYNRGAKPLLAGLSFVVQPGHRIAFVGTSGAGKSTVSRLLTGLERPWSGQVLLDGIPREDLDPAVLSASLALVDQSIVLFPGSIIDNLTLWDHSIDRDRVVSAARDAAIHDVIAARPGGYEAQVEEGARNFSGGQAQRIEIARALALDPTVLVLDEATSALDARTELDIDNAVRRRGCTTVVVAHRMSTIRDADLILVLDKGVVVQSGTHDELIDLDGLYRALVQS